MNPDAMTTALVFAFAVLGAANLVLDSRHLGIGAWLLRSRSPSSHQSKLLSMGVGLAIVVAALVCVLVVSTFAARH